MLLLWWFFLAPTAIGGPATYAIVAGTSMQPMLQPGDLVVAHRGDYSLGDVALFTVGSGLVVHQLVSGDSTAGWRTKGIHNSWIDPGRTTTEAIRGQFWFAVPKFGLVLKWIVGNPLLFGLFAAGLSSLSMLPRRKQRPGPDLVRALRRAGAERSTAGLDSQGVRVLVGCGLSTVLASLAVVALASGDRLDSAFGYAAIAGVGIGCGSSWLLYRRWREGAGLAEPQRTCCRLGDCLRLTPRFPDLKVPQVEVRSAVELRKLAQRYGLPVLHRTTLREDEFLLLTRRRAYHFIAPAP